MASSPPSGPERYTNKGTTAHGLLAFMSFFFFLGAIMLGRDRYFAHVCLNAAEATGTTSFPNCSTTFCYSAVVPP